MVAEPAFVVQAWFEAMPDPQVLLECVRDSRGRIVDFIYRDLNSVACEQLRVVRTEVRGRSVSRVLPGFVASGLLGPYRRCLETGAPVALDDQALTMFGEPRRYDIRGARAAADLLALSWRDVTDRYELGQRLIKSERHFRLLADNSSDIIVRLSDSLAGNEIAWVSPSVEVALGAPPDYWVGRRAADVVVAEDLPILAASVAEVEAGKLSVRRMRLLDIDGGAHWADVRVKQFYDADGRLDGHTASVRVIDDEVAVEGQLENARRRQAAADALYRRSMESAKVGMGLVDTEGRFVEVNDALCAFFGYDAKTLVGKTWQELTAAADLDASIERVNAVMSGGIDSFRAVKRYVHADGSLIWGDLSVGCVRAEDGQVEILIAQIIDITDQVAAQEQLAAQQARNEALAEQLSVEIRSAADYVVSTLPDDIAGPVALASRYLPSLELGGDCFNFSWLDDDHLAIYLVDVSGHGVRPALLSISVHNFVRSRSLSTRVLLNPHRVLARLNMLFRMDDQDGHYFTVWYGVYQASTGTLRYASAGHPPALAFVPTAGGWDSVELATECVPIGMFEDAVFVSGVYTMPAGGRLLLLSDGAFDFTLVDGRRATPDDVTDLSLRLLKDGCFSAGSLGEALRSRSAGGTFEDDCSLITAAFP